MKKMAEENNRKEEVTNVISLVGEKIHVTVNDRMREYTYDEFNQKIINDAMDGLELIDGYNLSDDENEVFNSLDKNNTKVLESIVECAARKILHRLGLLT